MSITDGWFREKEVMWPGQAMTLQVKEEIFQGKSDYQDILVFDSTNYGRVLVLDGVIQLTERDEHAYQEMITNLPLMSHPNPQHVLIVGGGDGGVLREVCRHSCVTQITMCEIDQLVVETAKKYLSGSTATSFDDPRLTLLFKDAAEYIKDYPNHFDCIIVDSSDPVGPAETLYTNEFYSGLKASLRAGGCICTQGECMWLHLELISEVMQHCGDLFPTVNYAYTTIPTYPSGQIGFLMCSLDESEGALVQPRRQLQPEELSKLNYYNSEIHKAAFVLPNFAERTIAPLRKSKPAP